MSREINVISDTHILVIFGKVVPFKKIYVVMNDNSIWRYASAYPFTCTHVFDVSFIPHAATSFPFQSFCFLYKCVTPPTRRKGARAKRSREANAEHQMTLYRQITLRYSSSGRAHRRLLNFINMWESRNRIPGRDTWASQRGINGVVKQTCALCRSSRRIQLPSPPAVVWRIHNIPTNPGLKCLRVACVNSPTIWCLVENAEDLGCRRSRTEIVIGERVGIVSRGDRWLPQCAISTNEIERSP